MNQENISLIPNEIIENKILLIRGKKVMLDKDLAILYEIKPIRLREQVKRNIKRFPADFMIQLTPTETRVLLSHFAIPKKSLGGYLPYVFTEQGIAMLSSVLKSDRAIQVNIQIMRTFTRLREIMINHADLKRAIEAIIKKQETKFNDYDQKIDAIFEIINKLLVQGTKEQKKYGFLVDRENK
jgi:hypothetical protein